MVEQMTLSVEWFDVMTRSSRIQTVHIWPSASLATLLESQGYPGAEVDPRDYYVVHDAWSRFGMGFPYLVVDGKVAWNVGYRDAILRDIVDSLGLDGKRIRHSGRLPTSWRAGPARRRTSLATVLRRAQSDRYCPRHHEHYRNRSRLDGAALV